MKNKLDKNLVQALSKISSIPKSLECIVYVDNINLALKNLEKDDMEVIATFPFIKALSLKLNIKKLNRLLTYNFVEYVSSQANVFALMNIAKKIFKINSSITGKNVCIAYIDTGINPHLDFVLGKNRIIKFIDLINNKILAYDDNGHGTFVCGVGSGNGLVSNKKHSGIAPNSLIVAIKALNKEGEANSTKILEAMQWIYDNNKKYGIKVVCMSFGSEPLGTNDPIMKGAEELWKLGIVVVAAAGNSGPDYETIKSPGVSPRIITVGGFNDNRLDDKTYNEKFFEIAEFSSRGPALKRFKPDVIAPSVNINSCGINGGYTSLSGTSVATPMVAGICALIYEKNSNIKPDTLKKMLTTCSRAITYNNNIEGFGIPDMEIILNNKILM
ncbi:MAG: S8 family peptidase [Clostridia bacterium]|nr:S8 family peptidase [Clostridia bacterium]MDD4685990.1 S8 family peptidase [Clostridia bacterium]